MAFHHHAHVLLSSSSITNLQETRTRQPVHALMRKGLSVPGLREKGGSSVLVGPPSPLRFLCRANIARVAAQVRGTAYSGTLSLLFCHNTKRLFIYNNMVGRSRRERSVQNSSRLFIRSVVVVELSSVTCMGFVRLSFFFFFSFSFLFVYVHTKVFCSLVNTYRRRRCPRRRWCGGAVLVAEGSVSLDYL